MGGTKNKAYQLAHKAWETRAAEIRRYSHPGDSGRERIAIGERLPFEGGARGLAIKDKNSDLRG